MLIPPAYVPDPEALKLLNALGSCVHVRNLISLGFAEEFVKALSVERTSIPKETVREWITRGIPGPNCFRTAHMPALNHTWK